MSFRPTLKAHRRLLNKPIESPFSHSADHPPQKTAKDVSILAEKFIMKGHKMEENNPQISVKQEDPMDVLMSELSHLALPMRNPAGKETDLATLSIEKLYRKLGTIDLEEIAYEFNNLSNVDKDILNHWIDRVVHDRKLRSTPEWSLYKTENFRKFLSVLEFLEPEIIEQIFSAFYVVHDSDHYILNDSKNRELLLSCLPSLSFEQLLTTVSAGIGIWSFLDGLEALRDYDDALAQLNYLEEEEGRVEFFSCKARGKIAFHDKNMLVHCLTQLNQTRIYTFSSDSLIQLFSIKNNAGEDVFNLYPHILGEYLDQSNPVIIHLNQLADR